MHLSLSFFLSLLHFIWFILPSSPQLLSVIHRGFYIRNLSPGILPQLASSIHASLTDLSEDLGFYPNLPLRLPSWHRPFIKQTNKQSMNIESHNTLSLYYY